jgi:polysaccharide chain length determinant protein (PEP-CTERM system associated)
MAVRNSFKLGPLSLVRMFWKHKLAFALVWVVTTGAAVVVVMRLPAIFRSETVIMIQTQRIPEKFVASTVNTALQDRLATLSQQILSYNRLLGIIQKYDLYHDERQTHSQEDIIEMMREDIGTEVVENWMSKGSRSDSHPSAFRVSYQGVNPTVVALVANELGNAFIDENLSTREGQAQGTTKFLETQLDEAKRRLEEQEAKLAEFKQKYNGELPQQENTLLATNSQLQIRLQGINDSIQRAEQNKQLLEASLASAQTSTESLIEISNQLNKPNDSSTPPGGQPPKTSEQLQRQLDEMRQRYKDTMPEVQELIGLVAVVRKEEEEKEKRLQAQAQKPNGAGPGQKPATSEPGQSNASGPAIATNATPRSAGLSQALLHERERMDALVAQRDVTDAQIESLNNERKQVLSSVAQNAQRMAKLPMREQQLLEINRDYEISKANYQSLLDKELAAQMATQMELAAQSERFVTIDTARTPDRPVKPNRPLLCGLSAFGALLLALVVSVGREFKKNTLLGEWEFPKGVAILGRVPVIVPDSKVVGAPQKPARGAGVRWGRRVLVPSLVVIMVMAVIAAAVGFYFGKILIGRWTWNQ